MELWVDTTSEWMRISGDDRQPGGIGELN